MPGALAVRGWVLEALMKTLKTTALSLSPRSADAQPTVKSAAAKSAARPQERTYTPAGPTPGYTRQDLMTGLGEGARLRAGAGRYDVARVTAAPEAELKALIGAPGLSATSRAVAGLLSEGFKVIGTLSFRDGHPDALRATFLSTRYAGVLPLILVLSETARFTELTTLERPEFTGTPGTRAMNLAGALWDADTCLYSVLEPSPLSLALFFGTPLLAELSFDASFLVRREVAAQAVLSERPRYRAPNPGALFYGQLGDQDLWYSPYAGGTEGCLMACSPRGAESTVSTHELARSPYLLTYAPAAQVYVRGEQARRVVDGAVQGLLDEAFAPQD